MIPPSFLHDLLGRTDIVEIVGRHVQLRKTGANLKGLCPFHAEKSPSFTVSPTRQTYHCFGCGVHGNALGFLMEHAGMGFVDAVHDLAQQTGLAVPEDEASPEERAKALAMKETRSTLSGVLAKASDHYRGLLKASPRAVDYLKARGLTGAIAAHFGLGYAADSWRGLASAFPRYDDELLETSGLVIAKEAEPAAEGDSAAASGGERKRYDRFRDRIMFPIRSVQGEVIGFGGRVLDRGEPKYLNSPETPVFSKGRELYGLFEARSAIRQRGYALVVEGYMDVVALAQAGYGNAVATLGTACTAEHIAKLFRFTEQIVFSFDGDKAGRRAAGRALEIAAPLATDLRTLRFLFLPPEHDPDSYIRAHGAEAFETMIEAAVPLSRQLIEHARDGGDPATAEGRARLLATAQPIWNSLPDGALKRQLLGDLARAGGLEPSDLTALWRERPPVARGSRGVDPGERADSGGADHQDDPGGWSNPDDRGSATPRRDRSDFSARGGFAGARSAAPPRRSAQRQAPSVPADHVLRILLLHSAWWDRLGHDDHELLHALPLPHGPLFGWLERYLADRGPTAWAVLEQALEEDGLMADVAPRMPRAAFEDIVEPADLRRLLDGLWVERLAAQQKALIEASALDPGALQRWREVETERQARLARMRSG